MSTELKYLGLFNKKSDHGYCRVSSRGIEQGIKLSVTEHKGFKRVEAEPRSISKTLSLVRTLDVDLSASRVSHQVPAYMLWELDPYSKGRNAFQISWNHIQIVFSHLSH